MNSLPMLSGFRARISGADTRKFQSAMFLAQLFTEASCYSFSLMRGHVFSEDLDQDLSILISERLTNVTKFLSTERFVHDETQETLAQTLRWLLDQEPDVIEAAATLRFYLAEGLGDPSRKLRWYNALSPATRRAAGELAPVRV